MEKMTKMDHTAQRRREKVIMEINGCHDDIRPHASLRVVSE